MGSDTNEIVFCSVCLALLYNFFSWQNTQIVIEAEWRSNARFTTTIFKKCIKMHLEKIWHLELLPPRAWKGPPFPCVSSFALVVVKVLFRNILIFWKMNVFIRNLSQGYLAYLYLRILFIKFVKTGVTILYVPLFESRLSSF